MSSTQGPDNNNNDGVVSGGVLIKTNKRVVIRRPKEKDKNKDGLTNTSSSKSKRARTIAPIPEELLPGESMPEEHVANSNSNIINDINSNSNSNSNRMNNMNSNSNSMPAPISLREQEQQEEQEQEEDMVEPIRFAMDLDIDSFMELYRVKTRTEHPSPHRGQITNTRIRGGSYIIPENEYTRFLDIYYRDVVKHMGKTDSLTETQLTDDGPCLVDLDFRLPLEVTERLYDRGDIDDLIAIYMAELKRMYQFDKDSVFSIYVMEKPTVNRVPEKNVTKDGLHLIIGIKMERRAQIILRRRVVEQVAELWGNEPAFPIQNTWCDVFDESITLARANWQMYGSCKPGGMAYRLTYLYEIYYSATMRDLVVNVRNMVEEQAEDPSYLVVTRDMFSALSARNTNNPAFFMRNSFISELMEEPEFRRGPAERDLVESATPRPSSMFVEVAEREEEAEEAGEQEKHPSIVSNRYLLSITTSEELVESVTWFLEEACSEPRHYIWAQVYNCLMVLPETYYGPGSYDKWMRVGWALRNMSDRLLIIWIAFSTRSPEFHLGQIHDLYYRWQHFRQGDDPDGLSHRSIMYWCRTEVPEEYAKLQMEFAKNIAERRLGKVEDADDLKVDRRGCTDNEIAEVLFLLFGDVYVCTSVSANEWYRFDEPRWRKCDAGYHLRMEISGTLYQLYKKKMFEYANEKSTLHETEDAYRIKKLEKMIEKMCYIMTRLKQSNDKKNIMTEAKEFFMDKTDMFIKKLDANPYLLCFRNGVFDFKSKTFRKGMPDDFLTKCTNTDYQPLDVVRDGPIMADIRKFMHELFPDRDVHDYAWEYLASILIGLLPDQTWNMFIGDGQNGKSLLMTIMGNVLGDYKVTIATNLLTDNRTKIGGTATELLMLKAVRLAIMQEPKPDEEVNEGIMKQLTSGMDTIEARGLYKAEMDIFKPQFKLVLCSNYFMKIKSNDHGTWRRIRVVPFKSLFTENPVANDPEKPYQFKVDYTLEERCKEWTQIFTAMLVEITCEKQGKTSVCPSVLAASNAYRENQDFIAEFVSDRLLVDPLGTIRKPDLMREFSGWYESTYGRSKSPNIKDVQAYLNKKFRWCNVTKMWTGVRIAESYGSLDPSMAQSFVAPAPSNVPPVSAPST